MRGFGKPLYLATRRYGKDRCGAAAAEFALLLSLLVIPILNVADLAIYAWDRMQLENAAQMAAQAAWETCDSGTKLPALTKCTGLAAAVAVAASSNSLGTGAVVGTLTEGNFCPNSGGTALVSAGTASDCSGINGSTDKPGDYLTIPVTYTYTPLFSGMSVVALLPTAMQSVGQMRLE
ncbi:MAG TPA: TadE/TadG family type IV pilus assembly protein [Rhizomicrobium sp.]|nr:TadE/TadG family type IV pilus assembly protein [Rhizomicrobium sp.]